jgi:hypothetical protein
MPFSRSDVASLEASLRSTSLDDTDGAVADVETVVASSLLWELVDGGAGLATG